MSRIAADLKSKLKDIFGGQIIFNKEFDKLSRNIKNINKNLINWCIDVKKQKIIPQPAKDEVVFIKKIGSSNRCIIIKVVNGEFKEIHLGDHKYYDQLRLRLGLKKSSVN